HILLPVGNLEDAARNMHERYGLQANPGGRHAAGGTANHIVPPGFQYLELIAVVEPSEIRDSHLGARVMQAASEGRTFVAWALRTTDLDALRARLLDAGSARAIPQACSAGWPRCSANPACTRCANRIPTASRSSCSLIRAKRR